MTGPLVGLLTQGAFRRATRVRVGDRLACDWCAGSGLIAPTLKGQLAVEVAGISVMAHAQEPCAKCDGRGLVEVRG